MFRPCMMGLELCSMDFDSSRLCLVDSGSLWLVIMPKSKDRFMERPPKKTVQPWAYMRTTGCSMSENLVWHANRWCGLSGLSWDPPGWEWVGKGVDSSENWTVTPHVTNSIIMVISVLIRHQNNWLIHFQAKPKEFQMDFNLKSLWESQEIPNFGIPNSCSWVYLSFKFDQDPPVQIAAILQVSINFNKFHSNLNT
jgi:hypothetical protein